MPQVTLRLNQWLGAQLGCAAYHLVFAEGRLATKEVVAALAPLSVGETSFADASAPVGRQDIASACAGAGMLLADTNLRFERVMHFPFGPMRELSATVRDAVVADRDAVAAIARASLRCSRFHRDPCIPQDTADALKAAWATNYFAGRRGDGMVVAETDRGVVGFLLYLVQEAEMVIDLVAIEHHSRGMGLGAALVEAAANRSGASRLVVGTQLANVAAVGFYENLGFRLAGGSHTFHFHGTPHENR